MLNVPKQQMDERSGAAAGSEEIMELERTYGAHKYCVRLPANPSCAATTRSP